MMKKITRIAALLAAGALLFGAIGCSSGSDGNYLEEEEKEEEKNDKSVSYDFADLTAADITALQLKSGDTLSKAALIESLNAKVLDSKVTIKQDQAKLKLKGKGDDPIAVAFGTDSAARTDSDAMPALTAGSALTLSRYISYPTTSGKKIQVKIECGEGMANDIAAGSYLVLTSADNKVLVSKAISASDTSVTLDAFDSKDSFNLGVLRGSQSGTFYVGKVTITETSGSSNPPVVDPETPPETPPEEPAEGQAKVTYFTNVGSSYSAAGETSDETIVKAKDIEIEWGTDATKVLNQCDTSVSSGKAVVQSEKVTLTENETTDSDGKQKADFVAENGEILVVKAKLTAVKNFTVKKISGSFENNKSSNTVLFVNDTNSGLSNNKVLTLKDYEPTPAIKGTAGSDVEIVFTIKANSSGVKGVTAADFQWKQSISDIEIVVEADE